ncbi:MAG: Fur family transcriptional regulator [Acidimicrobiales bacterium]
MERILALLRAQGGRLTATRRAIVTAIVGTRSHVTADELAEAVRVDHPDLHLTTVYRCLDTLERLGVVDHVHLGHGRAVYHLADEVHQHLVCEVCEAVVEVPSAVFEELAGQLRAAYGFAIRPHHFAVVGRCAACGEPEASIS